MRASVSETVSSPLNLPGQNLSKLSFCASDPGKVKTWLESLPGTDFTELAVTFYKTLPEVCRLQVPPGKYIALLETLHPHIHRCIEGLMGELLRQPLLLSPQMMKIALVTQALQRHLNDGYMIASRNLLQTKQTAAVQQALRLCLF